MRNIRDEKTEDLVRWHLTKDFSPLRLYSEDRDTWYFGLFSKGPIREFRLRVSQAIRKELQRRAYEL